MSGLVRSFRLDTSPWDPSAHWRIMTPSDPVDVGTQLDAHHIPETNGRMSVCRRCGARTDGPDGQHHVLHQTQERRSSDWLTAQARIRDIDRAKTLRLR